MDVKQLDLENSVLHCHFTQQSWPMLCPSFPENIHWGGKTGNFGSPTRVFY